MGEFIYGTIKLRILNTHDSDKDLERYIAEVIEVIAPNPKNGEIQVASGEKVTVKFRNEGKQPEEYFEQTAIFDGQSNDIQNKPDESIQQPRTKHYPITFNNPFTEQQEGASQKAKYAELINECTDFLVNNHNLILTGAPGTGKTYLAKDVAKRIISPTTGMNLDDFCGFVQFHPSYDYSDFVEGLRPYTKGDSNSNSTIGFKLKNGIFKEFCKKALEDKEHNFVFIIDEINRGEISKIFGELFFSIEPNYRGIKGKVETQYTNIQEKDTIFDPALGQGWFYIPKNVYIIGTMNDIDRSVESFDFAMRRRFVWKEITAKESAEKMSLPENTIKRMNSLNEAISKIEGLSSAYHIGASYFLKDGKPAERDDDEYTNLWKLRLEPLLREYLRSMPESEKKLEKLEKAYNEGTSG
jgi:5-methylcytosine-specific restriction endonuclease McrBC GTP-binding regulatory subunit McrB